ncbi:hypothetical protein D6810_00225, partial [Candidatus Dojkabacteria bacterium]
TNHLNFFRLCSLAFRVYKKTYRWLMVLAISSILSLLNYLSNQSEFWVFMTSFVCTLTLFSVLILDLRSEILRLKHQEL